MRDLIIFGDGAFARRLFAYISAEADDRVIAFTQEKQYINCSEIEGRCVVPFEDLQDCYDMNEVSILLGIGYSHMNELRKKVYELCKLKGYNIANFVSKSALVYSQNIGEGCIVFPGAMIGPFCRLGRCNIVSDNSSLSHDNTLGDYNYLSTNSVLAGGATIGNNCFIGLHSTIKNSIIIPDYTLVGSAANVLKSVSYRGGVLIGNPARLLEGKKSIEVQI